MRSYEQSKEMVIIYWGEEFVCTWSFHKAV